MKDRPAGEAPPRESNGTRSERRNENSGLIDLDALLREASSPDLSAAAATAAPPQKAAPPAQEARPAKANAKQKAKAAPVSKPPPEVAPAPASARERSDSAGSLDGISTPTSPSPTSSAAVAIALVERPSGAADSEAPPSASPSSLQAQAPAPAKPRSRRRTLAVLAGVAAVACVAVVSYRASHRGSASVGAAPIASIAAAATPAPPPATAPSPVGPAEPAAPELDPTDLPAANSDAKVAAAHPAHRPAHGAAPPAPSGEPAQAKVSDVVLPDGPGDDSHDLGDAMRGAVGTRATTDTAPTTKASNNARTLRPSPGAVVGAINGVLPAARSCLAPDDPVRTASITFRSDGSVAKVDIAGARPADGCVRSSLMNARIEPFADDTFVTRVTVRP